MNQKIAIIGFGYVGQAYYDFFKNHYEIYFYDPGYLTKIAPKIGRYSDSQEEINKKCKFALISVPTPPKEDGSCDISIVEASVKWLKTPFIMIKSTVVPGTTEYLKKKYKKRIVFSPEYIGEGGYYVPPWKYPHPTDIKSHGFVIIGGDRQDRILWIELFKKVMGPDAHYLQTDSTTAELVKYGENAWGAMKVTFFNEFFNICQVFGVEYDEFRELLLYDKRIERMHTAVFRDKRGFGGKCFPKDVMAIYKATKEKGYDAKILKQVIESNEEFKKLNKKV